MMIITCDDEMCLDDRTFPSDIVCLTSVNAAVSWFRADYQDLTLNRTTFKSLSEYIEIPMIELACSARFLTRCTKLGSGLRLHHKKLLCSFQKQQFWLVGELPMVPVDLKTLSSKTSVWFYEVSRWRTNIPLIASSLIRHVFETILGLSETVWEVDVLHKCIMLCRREIAKLDRWRHRRQHF